MLGKIWKVIGIEIKLLGVFYFRGVGVEIEVDFVFRLSIGDFGRALYLF